jgi:hypothetical protein
VLLGFGRFLHFVLLAAQMHGLNHVVLEHLHGLRHGADLIAALLRRDNGCRIAACDLAHRSCHRLDRHYDAASEQERHADDEQQRDAQDDGYPPNLLPENCIDVIQVDAAANRPAIWFELDSVRYLGKWFSSASPGKTIGDEAAALGGQFNLLPREIDPVRVRGVVQILVLDLRVRMGLHYTLRVEGVEIIVLTETQCAQECSASLKSFRFRQSGFLRRLIIKINGLPGEKNQIVKLGLPILEQVIAQSGKTDAGDDRDANNGHTDHNHEP